MLASELLRWAALAAVTAAVVRFPRPIGFWSHGAREPLVLARATVGSDRFRQAAGV